MRTIYALSLGLITGVIATVLLFTLNDALRGPTIPAAGVGNARVEMDSHSLGLIATASIDTEPDRIPVVAEVDIRSEGTLVVSFGLAPDGSGPQGSVVLDPEVRDGTLVVVVVESDLRGTTPEFVAISLERQLRARLESLAGDHDYTLVSIATGGGQLVLEITI